MKKPLSVPASALRSQPFSELHSIIPGAQIGNRAKDGGGFSRCSLGTGESGPGPPGGSLWHFPGHRLSLCPKVSLSSAKALPLPGPADECSAPRAGPHFLGPLVWGPMLNLVSPPQESRGGLVERAKQLSSLIKTLDLFWGGLGGGVVAAVVRNTCRRR